jgi:probable HAF family extracellular repeat protein
MAVLNMTGIFPGAALAINSSGQVAGYSFKRAEIHSHSIYQSGQHAVLWDNGTTTSLLGDVSEGDHSLASGINDHGQVVGEAITSWFQGGFLWQNGQITPVGDVRVRPRAINNSGQIAGRFHVGTSTRAFLWQYGTLTELPMLPGHGISDAFSINGAGQAVGFSQDPDPVNSHTRRAVIWSGGVVKDLTAMLPPNSGWTLGMAFGISDAGHVVGFGLHQGLRKGFLMTLPREPVVSDQ